jgi:hypothetical protein
MQLLNKAQMCSHHAHDQRQQHFTSTAMPYLKRKLPPPHTMKFLATQIRRQVEKGRHLTT